MPLNEGLVLAELLQMDVLVAWLASMVFGIFVGATPGLTATMAVALIVPMSFYLPPNAGLAMIIGVSFTAIFAGDIPATYLRIPGTPASAVATLDGYRLAQKGKGRLALHLDLICSCIGGLIGVGLLMGLAPQLARASLRLSHFEYFWLTIFGLTLSALACKGRLHRGLLAATLGMGFSTIGIDMVSASARFTFGKSELMGGIGFIPAMIGLFGISEVLRNVCQSQNFKLPALPKQSRFSFAELRQSLWRKKGIVAKSSTLGTLIGALPGAGADIAAWVAYGVARRTSRNAQSFGKGNLEGVIAPTSANNAAVAGAWIPALVFGIPGDSVTAIVLGALLMYDIQPGPMLFEQSGSQVQNIFLIALATQLMLLPAGYLGIRAFGGMLRLPRAIVLVAVMVASIVGTFALQGSLFDVCCMLGFGLMGFLLEALSVPLAPLILGLILGRKVEENLRIGLIQSDGSWAPFFTRPICLVLLILLASAYLCPVIFAIFKNSSMKR